MEKIIKENSTTSKSDFSTIQLNHDYLLFRQDDSSSEQIYFSKDEINEIIDKIEKGEIVIHPNYSVLFSKSRDLMTEAPDLGCFKTVFK